MTALAAPRIAPRRIPAPAARVSTLTSLRESLQGFRGALRSATETRGSDYADALFLGRN